MACRAGVRSAKPRKNGGVLGQLLLLQNHQICAESTKCSVYRRPGFTWTGTAALHRRTSAWQRIGPKSGGPRPSYPRLHGLHRGGFRNGDTLKMDFFPPLTLMPCDSGRDNQLRVKSPPMIVIINLKTQTKPTKNNKFRGDDETHHGTVECTDAK